MIIRAPVDDTQSSSTHQRYPTPAGMSLWYHAPVTKALRTRSFLSYVALIGTLLLRKFVYTREGSACLPQRRHPAGSSLARRIGPQRASAYAGATLSRLEAPVSCRGHGSATEEAFLARHGHFAWA